MPAKAVVSSPYSTVAIPWSPIRDREWWRKSAPSSSASGALPEILPQIMRHWGLVWDGPGCVEGGNIAIEDNIGGGNNFRTYREGSVRLGTRRRSEGRSRGTQTRCRR